MRERLKANSRKIYEDLKTRHRDEQKNVFDGFCTKLKSFDKSDENAVIEFSDYLSQLKSKQVSIQTCSAICGRLKNANDILLRNNADGRYSKMIELCKDEIFDFIRISLDDAKSLVCEVDSNYNDGTVNRETADSLDISVTREGFDFSSYEFVKEESSFFVASCEALSLAVACKDIIGASGVFDVYKDFFLFWGSGDIAVPIKLGQSKKIADLFLRVKDVLILDESLKDELCEAVANHARKIPYPDDFAAHVLSVAVTQYKDKDFAIFNAVLKEIDDELKIKFLDRASIEMDMNFFNVVAKDNSLPQLILRRCKDGELESKHAALRVMGMYIASNPTIVKEMLDDVQMSDYGWDIAFGTAILVKKEDAVKKALKFVADRIENEELNPWILSKISYCIDLLDSREQESWVDAKDRLIALQRRVMELENPHNKEVVQLVIVEPEVFKEELSLDCEDGYKDVATDAKLRFDEVVTVYDEEAGRSTPFALPDTAVVLKGVKVEQDLYGLCSGKMFSYNTCLLRSVLDKSMQRSDFESVFNEGRVARNRGQTGFKFLGKGVWELKIDGDERILGKMVGSQKNETILFFHYLRKAHTGSNLVEAAEQVRKSNVALMPQVQQREVAAAMVGVSGGRQ